MARIPLNELLLLAAAIIITGGMMAGVLASLFGVGEGVITRKS